MAASNGGKKIKPAFLAGGGEMGELIRQKYWSATPLGPPELWPFALKQTVSMMLTTAFPVLICWGKDYIQLYNDAFRPINGEAKHPQALGGCARDTYAEIWDLVEPMFTKVMGGQTVSFEEFKVPLNRSGFLEDRFFDFSYSPIMDEYGLTGGILVICVDTTQKVKAMAESHSLNEEMTAINEELAASNEELASANSQLASTNVHLIKSQDNLRRSEKLFKSIAVNIPNSLIIMIDKSHRFMAIEGDLMVKLGYDSKDYAGKHPTEVGPLERYEASKHFFQRVLSGERFSLERKADSGADFMVHFVPIRNDADEVEAGLIIALEITEFKQAQEKSAKLAAIVESSDDAIISKTLESVITSWNNAAERIFGYTADEIIGETIYKLIPPDRQDEEPQILARLKSGERVEHFETKRVTKDGILLDVSLTISPVKDDKGNIIGLSKIVRDISEKKIDEVRKNDFIGMASHELKTPLTSLNAILQVTNSKIKNSDDAFLVSAIEKANIQVKRMIGMINGFLNISRLEAGKILIEKAPFELLTLLMEVIDEINLIAGTHKITINSDKPLTVFADRDKISSVLTNLISNAVKYSSRGTAIAIGYSLKGAMVEVSVKDEGIGIGPDDLEMIFNRYHRVENDHTRHIAGFGIGLYLSAEIIDRHNGKVWAESEIGKGSTFYFSLPLK